MSRCIRISRIDCTDSRSHADNDVQAQVCGQDSDIFPNICQFLLLDLNLVFFLFQHLVLPPES